MYFNSLFYREYGFETARSTQDLLLNNRFKTTQLSNNIPTLPMPSQTPILSLDIDKIEEK